MLSHSSWLGQRADLDACRELVEEIGEVKCADKKAVG